MSAFCMYYPSNSTMTSITKNTFLLHVHSALPHFSSNTKISLWQIITTPLIYSCSGSSSAAQLANYVTVKLNRIGMAEMSCIPAVGGDVKKLVKMPPPAEHRSSSRWLPSILRQGRQLGTASGNACRTHTTCTNGRKKNTTRRF